MPECDGNLSGQAMFLLEPWLVVTPSTPWRAGYIVDTATQFITKTQACQNVVDQAQAFPAGSVLAPPPWAVSIHVA